MGIYTEGIKTGQRHISLARRIEMGTLESRLFNIGFNEPQEFIQVA